MNRNVTLPLLALTVFLTLGAASLVNASDNFELSHITYDEGAGTVTFTATDDAGVSSLTFYAYGNASPIGDWTGQCRRTNPGIQLDQIDYASDFPITVREVDCNGGTGTATLNGPGGLGGTITQSNSLLAYGLPIGLAAALGLGAAALFARSRRAKNATTANS